MKIVDGVKVCDCGGNNSLRMAIGRVRCECGGSLNDAQVTMRIISRLDEIEEDQFRMIGALQRLGADRCDQCGEWELHCWSLYDHCLCLRCLEGNPEGPLEDEGLEEKEYDEMEQSIVRFLSGRGIRIHSKRLNEVRNKIAGREA